MKNLILILFLLPFSVLAQQNEMLKNKLNADLIEMDQENQDGTFKARNKATKMWGMYQMRSAPVEMIPMNYDSLDFFGFNQKFTIVYKNGKQGIYLCYFDYEQEAKQTVPCLYEDFKKVIVPYKGENRFPPISYSEEYLAAKINGKWGWINWFTGEVQSEFIYDTVEDLPTPEYTQNWM